MRGFDVVIIGSGCGASPAAENLSNAGFRVCVLERGTWWGDLHGHASFPENGLQFLAASRGLGLSLPFLKKYIRLNLKRGLLEYHLFGRYLNIAACGVGGGSLVIGGFMDRPPADHWKHYPEEVNGEVMEQHYANIDAIVEPANRPKPTPYEDQVTRACEGIEGVRSAKQRLSIWFADGPDTDQERINGYGIRQRNHDYRCGDFAGTNRGYKNSMDATCLQTVLKNGGEIRSLCEAVGIRKNGRGYVVDYVDIAENTRKSVAAARVMVAAGAVNTTKLLFASKRNTTDGLPLLSDQLGNRFGFNGDRVGFGWAPHANIDHRYGSSLFNYQEIASPVYEYDFHMFATRSAVLPWLVPIRAIHKRLMIFLALTREEPVGTIRPDGEVMRVHYPSQESHRRAARLQRRITMEFDALFKPLSEQERRRKVAAIEQRNPGRGWASVHQCGGAAMAQDASGGVVDHKGEVFHYPGLYVSDASIYPAAPCCGPHYTILAQSDRISRQIIADA